MGEKDLQSIGQIGEDSTQTIELTELFTKDLTATGSFDGRWDIWKTTFGKVVQALPIPTVMIDTAYRVLVANQAWGKISPDYERIEGALFSTLFPNAASARKVQALLEEVFSTRKPRAVEGMLAIGQSRMWGRVTFRSIRIMAERSILAMVEDLTLEKRLLQQDRKHREELERRVEERTAELVRKNEELRREVTERMRVEASLRESEESLRLLIESAPIGVQISHEGKYQYVNPAFVAMFGYERADEIVGLPLADLLSPADKDVVESRMKPSSDTGETVVFHEITGMKKNGAPFSVSVWSTSITFRGESGILGFVADVSEEKALRSQLLRAQKLEAVGTLAGGIAHDFNNLLTVVLGHADMLVRRYDQQDRAYGAVRAIREAARHGRDLVRRILTFSRNVDTALQPVDLNWEVRQAQGLLQRTLPAMIGIEMQLGDRLSMVSADPSQVQQVLLNLVLNARDAMPDGGRLVIRTSNAFLDEDYCKLHPPIEPGEYVLLEVADTGHGMDKDVLDHMFEPFFTTKKASEGSGLGLAMVFGIVESHRGHITCESRSGQGTTFKIYLPVTTEEAGIDPVSTLQLPAMGKGTVLIVDDDDLIRELGREMLGLAGYRVLTAANGIEALEIYKNLGAEISLVILDLLMPEMDGTKCLEELLTIDPEVKVLVASGYTLDGVGERSLQKGAKGFISKPFETKQLLKSIFDALNAGSNRNDNSQPRK